jgi:hypothetical protein
MRIKKLAQLPHGNETMIKPREVAFRKRWRMSGTRED